MLYLSSSPLFGGKDKYISSQFIRYWHKRKCFSLLCLLLLELSNYAAAVQKEMISYFLKSISCHKRVSEDCSTWAGTLEAQSDWMFSVILVSPRATLNLTFIYSAIHYMLSYVVTCRANYVTECSASSHSNTTKVTSQPNIS